jgi:hypothetical protein
MDLHKSNAFNSKNCTHLASIIFLKGFGAVKQMSWLLKPHNTLKNLQKIVTKFHLY